MDEIEKIADAILYEGYALFPYRADALKNRKRFNFGVLAPRAWAENRQHETFFQQTECLILSPENSFGLSLRARFLQIEDQTENWRTARKIEIEKNILSGDLNAGKRIFDFAVEAEINFSELRGRIAVSLDRLEKNAFKIKVVLQNLTETATAPATSTG